MMHSSSFIDAFFKPELLGRSVSVAAQGLYVTVQIAVLVVISGLVLGLLLASLRSPGFKVLNILILVFVDVFRALPPLVLIMIIYFGLPGLGVNIPSFAVLWLVLTLVLGAFVEEIFWAGITALPRGQWEAARSSGLNYVQTFAYVILPQAFRMSVPPLTNRAITITKNTALGSVIGVGEIVNQTTTLQSFTGNATPLMVGAVTYTLLFIPIIAAGRWIERRFAWTRV